MKNPSETAKRLMRDFYKKKGQKWPADEASELAERIRVDPRHHRWVVPGSANLADQIFRRSVFDVDEFAESLHIRVDYDRLDYLDEAQGSPVYGYACPNIRQIVICERASDYEPLHRTTVIHEAGHVLLHPEPAQRSRFYTPLQTQDGDAEREANEFMWSAILPRSVLRLAIAFVCNIHSIDIQLAIQSANTTRGRWIWRNRLFSTLINLLCVSREMICISLKKSGCFSPDTVAFHKSYALETKWHTPKSNLLIGPGAQRVLSRLEHSCISVSLT